MFQLIPMSVLYGVFLYMGITSLRGVQVISHDSKYKAMFHLRNKQNIAMFTHYILSYFYLKVQ